MSEVTVRRLVSGDDALARETFATIARIFENEVGALSPRYVQGLLRRGDFWAYAAVRDAVVVGGLTAYTLPLTRVEESEVFIYDIAVDPSVQRQGIGRRLVEALRRDAAAEDIAVIFVPADNEDTHALDFYQAIGGDAAPVTIFTFGGAT
jgi:aminoglycoside 3-N-acetyltransferase I